MKIVVSYTFLLCFAGCKQTCFDELHEGKTYSTRLAGRYDAEKWQSWWVSDTTTLPNCGSLVNPDGFSFRITGHTNDPNCELPFGTIVQPPGSGTIAVADPAIRTNAGTLVAFPTYQLTIGACSGIWSPWLHSGTDGDHLKPIEPGKQPPVVYHSYFAPTEASMGECVSAGFPTGTALCEDAFAVDLQPAPIK